MPQYTIARVHDTPALDAAWTGGAWAGAETAEIASPVGGVTEHRPQAHVKLLYDDRAVYAAFCVSDRFVRAVAQAYQDPVCQDSCVEFFFTPGEDVAAGYFNLEMNCGGTFLFKHQRGRGIDVQAVTPDDARQITVYHSLPRMIEPEITDAVAWEVAYRLPLDMLSHYADVAAPAPGVRWRANFYKCGDCTSQPHWLAWSPVDVPRPDFHRPEFFGVLEFA
jgi:hypothetical protein